MWKDKIRRKSCVAKKMDGEYIEEIERKRANNLRLKLDFILTSSGYCLYSLRFKFTEKLYIQLYTDHCERFQN